MASGETGDAEFDAAIGRAQEAGGFSNEDTSLFAVAIQTHEAFTTHLQAGFTNSQALYITAVMITGNPGIPPKH